MSKLLPYETIVKAHEGDLEAVNAVLRHYAGYIRYFSKVNGQVNAEVEDYVKQRLIDCQKEILPYISIQSSLWGTRGRPYAISNLYLDAVLLLWYTKQ